MRATGNRIQLRSGRVVSSKPRSVPGEWADPSQAADSSANASEGAKIGDEVASSEQIIRDDSLNERQPVQPLHDDDTSGVGLMPSQSSDEPQSASARAKGTSQSRDKMPDSAVVETSVESSLTEITDLVNDESTPWKIVAGRKAARSVSPEGRDRAKDYSEEHDKLRRVSFGSPRIFSLKVPFEYGEDNVEQEEREVASVIDEGIDASCSVLYPPLVPSRYGQRRRIELDDPSGFADDLSDHSRERIKRNQILQATAKDEDSEDSQSSEGESENDRHLFLGSIVKAVTRPVAAARHLVLNDTAGVSERHNVGGLARETSEQPEASSSKGKRRARGNRPLQDAQEDEDEKAARALQAEYDAEVVSNHRHSPKAKVAGQISAAGLKPSRLSSETPSLGSERTRGSASARASTVSMSREPASQIPKGSFIFKRMQSSPSDPSSDSDTDSGSESSKSSKASQRVPGDRIRHPGDHRAHKDDPSEPSSSSESDSSSSSSESSISEARKKRKSDKRKAYKRRTKEKRAISRHIKCPEPAEYEGGANFSKYEQFVFESSQWLEMTDMPKRFRVTSLKRFLKGKAGKFFMDFVVPNPDDYNLKKFYRELFNYCFPAHFLRDMRSRFVGCTQGSRQIRDYVRELRTLAKVLPDIGDLQLRMQFWSGARPYFRREWAKAGYDPEVSDLKDLEEAAERYEQAELMMKREGMSNDDDRGSRHGHHRDRSRHCERDNKHRHHRRNDSKSNHIQVNSIGGASGSQPRKGPRSNHKGSGKPYSGKRPKPKSGDQRKVKGLTKQELRAEGRCYECGELNHLAKDCPKRTMAPKPSVGSAMIDFDELEDLSSASQGLSSLAVRWALAEDIATDSNDESTNSVSHHWEMFEADLIDAPYATGRVTDLLREQLDAGAPYTEGGRSEDYVGVRFVIAEDPWDSNITVTDRALENFTFRIDRDSITNPSFDVAEHYRSIVACSCYITPYDNPTDGDLALLLGWHSNVLDQAAPYPGDPQDTRVYTSRFSAHQYNEDEIMFEDRLTANSFWVQRHQLDEVTFRIDLHYRGIREVTSRMESLELDSGSIQPFEVSSAPNVLLERAGEAGLVTIPGASDTVGETARYWANAEGLHHISYLDDVLTDNPDGMSAFPFIQGVERGPVQWHGQRNDDASEYLTAQTHMNMDSPPGLAPVSGSTVSTRELDDEEESQRGSYDLPESSHGGGSSSSSSSGGAPGMIAPHRPGKIFSALTDDAKSDMGCRPTSSDKQNSGAGHQWSSVAGSSRGGGSDSTSDDDTANLRNRVVSRTELIKATMGAYSDFPDTSPVSQTPRVNLYSVGQPSVAARKSRGAYKARPQEPLQRNCAKVKDFQRMVPRSIIIDVKINGHDVRALVDSGSLADFMSTRLADQLAVPLSKLEKPLPVQLAVSGSRTSVNACTVVDFSYQKISEKRHFDIMNLESYDLILGTPFLFQHKVVLGMNPSRVAIRAEKACKIEGDQVTKISARLTDVLNLELDKIRQRLKDEAKDLCKSVGETSLPPFRAINHHIPIIDPKKVYPWRPSKCPEALKAAWEEKRNEYIKSGRWEVASGQNAAPMLILAKKPDPNRQVRIRTVIDKRAVNANTKKFVSPLPDIEGILWNIASHRYRSIMDGKDAYEQIRVVEEDIPKTLFGTPNGTMVSKVLQQGDCNGGATYQALMNYIFAPYIGVFMDVYLDDIMIYSDSIEDHVRHIHLIFDVLRREKLYLSADKMHFFCDKMNILGHVITDDGIQIDPHKVDSIASWKVPTNRELLAGFLGTVGYVARGCEGIRIPMAVLTPLSGSTKPWRWGPTEQRAFDEIKRIVERHRNMHTKPISDDPSVGPINLTTDASLTGGGGTLSQGEDLKTANYIAFWSGKFNLAQQNYATHERELLALVETLKRFRSFLIGRKFRCFTDHKALEWLDTQKSLSPCQLRWLKTLQEFDYTVHYLPGPENVAGDALSRMYSDEPTGTVRSPSEYIEDDTEDEYQRDRKALRLASTTPLYTGEPVMAVFKAKLVDVSPKTSNEPTTVRRSARASKAPQRLDPDWSSTRRPKVVKPKDGTTAGGPNTVAEASKPSSNKMESDMSTAGSFVTEGVVPSVPQMTSSGVGAQLKVAPAENEELHMEISNDIHLNGDSHLPEEALVPREGANESRESLQRDEVAGSEMSQPIPESSHPAPNLAKAISTPDASNNMNDPAHPNTSTTPEMISGGRVVPNEHREGEGILKLVEMAENLSDLVQIVKDGYSQDRFFDAVNVDPARYNNFRKRDDLIYLEDSGYSLLCIPDVMAGEQRLRGLLISQAHSLLAHLGSSKTLAYLREQVWWPSMRKDVALFCASCVTCDTSKSRTQAPYGLLKSLEVPSYPWQYIGVDFVGPLPLSKNRNGLFDMITVFIDHLTSMVHLVVTKQTYRAKDVAEVVFENVYKLHGLPERIISDRDSLFTSMFWTHLHALIGVKLKMGSAYHPQTDGSTERANRTLTQMLQQCVSPSQTDWALKLPNIEFALNLARSETTGFSPFFLNYGRTPHPMVWNSQSPYPGVRVFAERMKDAILSAHDAIIEARVRQTTQANKHRLISPFKVGDLVYISMKNMKIPKLRARKLSPKYIGPIRIVREASEGASYELDLPSDLKARGIHPVFHASLLRVHVPNDDRVFPGRQLTQFIGFSDDPQEWAVEKIVGHVGKGKGVSFLVKWQSGDETWASYREVSRLNALSDYLELHGAKSVDELPKTPLKDQFSSVAVSLIDIFNLEEEVFDGQTSSLSPPSEPHYLNLNLMSANPANPAPSSVDAINWQYYEALKEYQRTGVGHPGSAPAGFTPEWVAAKIGSMSLDYINRSTCSDYYLISPSTSESKLEKMTDLVMELLRSASDTVNKVAVAQPTQGPSSNPHRRGGKKGPKGGPKPKAKHNAPKANVQGTKPSPADAQNKGKKAFHKNKVWKSTNPAPTSSSTPAQGPAPVATNTPGVKQVIDRIATEARKASELDLKKAIYAKAEFAEAKKLSELQVQLQDAIRTGHGSNPTDLMKACEEAKTTAKAQLDKLLNDLGLTKDDVSKTPNPPTNQPQPQEQPAPAVTNAGSTSSSEVSVSVASASGASSSSSVEQAEEVQAIQATQSTQAEAEAEAVAPATQATEGVDDVEMSYEDYYGKDD